MPKPTTAADVEGLEEQHKEVVKLLRELADECTRPASEHLRLSCAICYTFDGFHSQLSWPDRPCPVDTAIAYLASLSTVTLDGQHES